MSTVVPRVLELRLSFAWTETWSALAGSDDDKAPRAFLGAPNSVANRYDQIGQPLNDLEQEWKAQDQVLQASHTGDKKTLAAKRVQLRREFQLKLANPEVLTPPWPWLGRNYAHHFWQYYLGNIEPNNLSGNAAWQYVVPLRVHVPVRIGSPWPPGGFKCIPLWDGLLYPHGVVAVLTLRLLFRSLGGASKGLGLKLATDRGLRMLYSEQFPVRWPGAPQEKLKLDQLANRLLDYLRERALGAGAEQEGSRPTQPITTTATVVQGGGGDATVPIAATGLEHKALEGLCSWDNQWYKVEPQKSLKEANLLLGQAPAGHMVYHTARGRAVWMPDYFNAHSGRDQHKLSCYHRNLTLVTLQTEMLAQAVTLCTEYLDSEHKPPEAVTSLAQNAAIRLGHLYENTRKGSKKYTYNSASPRFYLEENGYLELIKQAQESFEEKLPPLAYTPWP